MKKNIFSILMVIVLLNTGCSINTSDADGNMNKEGIKKLTQNDKLNDFEYMYKILQENYPFFEVNRRLTGVDWLDSKDKYKEIVKRTKSDEEFFNALNNILFELHNGHTHMISMQEYPYYINNYENYPASLAPWLNQLKSDKSRKRYAYENGKRITGNVTKPAKGIQVYDNIEMKILLDNRVAYLQIKSFNDQNMESEANRIKEFLQSIKNYKALLIDIRGNMGGNSLYWKNCIVPVLIEKPLSYITYFLYRGGRFEEDFIESTIGSKYDSLDKIEKLYEEGLKNVPSGLEKNFKYYEMNYNTVFPQNPVGYKGKIYLLVDRNNFSSSEEFAMFSKSTGFATLVGEKTGGDGIPPLNPALCALPNSGYIFQFSIVMGLTADGTCNEEFKTQPDIEVLGERNENAKKDKVVQYIMQQVK